jgi:hypothetical protein
MDLFSTEKADYKSRAEVAVPEGLKVTSPVALLVDLSEKPKPADKQDAKSHFVIKTYWGSAKEVPRGQPRTAMSDSVTAPPSDKLPDASYAYWPSLIAKPLEEDASAAGAYTLKTNYCGGTAFTLASDQEFLAPIDLIGIHKKADLDKPIAISWKTVPRAVGYLVTATGGTDLESINWTSSANPDAAAGIEEFPHTRAEIASYVEKKVLLPPHAVTCTIPAGAFKGSKSVFVNVTAFGPDMVQVKDGVETRVVVRSTAGIPIYGTSYRPVIEEDGKSP